MDVAHARRHTTHVIDAVAEQLYGVETVIKLSLAALLSGGHVLLEGNPGLGKTELVKRLAHVMNLRAGRIQFTPDLMPADITGTLMPTGNGGLRFQSGPIFTSLLLADEINRATPKTQSAMLEAMAEKKVTVLGEEHALPSPFVVLATQNPIDHEGTYNLPAAQSDRFMFKVRMPVPDGPTLKRIVHKRAGAGAPDPQSDSATTAKAETASPVNYDLPGDARAAESLVREISQVIRTIAPLPAVEAHVTNLFLATNRSFAGLTNPSGTRADIEAASRRVQYGMSPRAAGDIMLAAKAWVCLSDTDVQYVAASHLQAVVVHALRHRLRLSLDDDHAPVDDVDDIDGNPELRLDDAIRRLCLLTAPKDSGYDALWQRCYA